MRRLLFEELGGGQELHHLAVTRLRPGERSYTHTHDFPEIFLVESGTGLHEWNGRRLTLEPGSLTLVRPADVHAFRGAAGERLSFLNLAVPAAWWEGFERLLPTGGWGRLRWLGEPPGHVRLAPAEARSAAEALHGLLQQGGRDPVRLVTVVAQLVGYLLPVGDSSAAGGAVSGPALAGEGAPDWLRAFCRDLYAPELLAQPIGFWQRRSGVGPAHFARTCRRFLGEPPTVRLNRARVEWVQTRLRQGEEKIAALALDAGFQNLGFFYRCFRRFAGCPPRAWRARHAAAVTVPR